MPCLNFFFIHPSVARYTAVQRLVSSKTSLRKMSAVCKRRSHCVKLWYKKTCLQPARVPATQLIASSARIPGPAPISEHQYFAGFPSVEKKKISSSNMKMFFALVSLCLLGSALGAVKDACVDTAACSDPNLVCQGGKCRTVIGQGCTAGSNDECVETADPCPAGAGAKCTCANTKVSSSDNTKCLSKVDQTCAADGDCITNANCPAGNARTCKCNTNYVANAGKDKCLKIVNQACGNDNECLTNGACTGTGNDKKCACKANYVASYALNGCDLAPGQQCQTAAGSPPCSENSACTGGTCKCNNGFITDNNQRCGKKSGADCQNSNECVNDATCDSKKCTCKTDYKADDKGFCKKSGASAVMASTVLLLAALVTSRWM